MPAARPVIVKLPDASTVAAAVAEPVTFTVAPEELAAGVIVPEMV